MKVKQSESRIRDMGSPRERNHSSMFRGITVLAMALAMPFSLGVSQVQQGTIGSDPKNAPGAFPVNPLADRHVDGVRLFQDSIKKQEDQKRIEALNIERQKELASDTSKLLQLANELKVEMDKSGHNTLSMNEVLKADLIEKLAHAVQEKMKASIGN